MLKRLPRRVTPRYPVGLFVERISRTPSYSVGSASAAACMAVVLGRGLRLAAGRAAAGGAPAAAGVPSCGRLVAAAAAACMRAPSCWLSKERLTGPCWPVLGLGLGLAAAARPAACLLVLGLVERLRLGRGNLLVVEALGRAAACLLVLAAARALSGWVGLVERLTGLVERLTGPL